ncbi:MAG TPA: DinB family protein [Gemmatimonadaceae bacterium]|nr:DinB family protein [Gemmatimonadaceae bacterium]
MTQATSEDILTESPVALLFPDLDSELATTRRMLERVPDGKDDWKPHPKSRSLGELATHLAQLPGFGIVQVTQDVVDGTAGPPRAKVANNAERLELFDQVSGEFRRQLQQITWERAHAPWTMTVNGRPVIKAPRAQIIRSIYFMHSAHHRAQLGVYLRLLDVAVPWSYGDSADERPPMPQADGA